MPQSSLGPDCFLLGLTLILSVSWHLSSLYTICGPHSTLIFSWLWFDSGPHLSLIIILTWAWPSSSVGPNSCPHCGLTLILTMTWHFASLWPDSDSLVYESCPWYFSSLGPDSGPHWGLTLVLSMAWACTCLQPDPLPHWASLWSSLGPDFGPHTDWPYLIYSIILIITRAKGHVY